jgi:hypothetical protein
VNAGEEGHQVPDVDLLERMHRVLDLVGEVAVDAIGCELVELFDRVVPGERVRRPARAARPSARVAAVFVRSRVTVLSGMVIVDMAAPLAAAV